MRSKTLILALIRGIQQALPGTEDVKAIIHAVLTRWTMHYQAFWRLGELHDVIVVVVRDDERKPVKDRNLVTGNVTGYIFPNIFRIFRTFSTLVISTFYAFPAMFSTSFIIRFIPTYMANFLI